MTQKTALSFATNAFDCTAPRLCQLPKLAVVDLVLFDCDGTLIDNEREGLDFIGAQIDHGLVANDLPAYGRSCRQLAGKPMAGILDFVQDEISVTISPRLRREITERIKKLRAKGPHPEERTVTVTWAKHALRSLRAMGVDSWIVTSSERPRAEKFITRAGIAEHFRDDAGLACRNMAREAPRMRLVSAYHDFEAPRLKPDPACYLDALRRSGHASSSAVAVEDSASGVKAAKAAGLYVIGTVAASHIATARKDHVAAALIEAGADNVVYSLKEFIPALVTADKTLAKRNVALKLG